MSSSLARYLVRLGRDPAELEAFRRSPREAAQTEGLTEIERLALERGDANLIRGLLAGQRVFVLPGGHRAPQPTCVDIAKNRNGGGSLTIVGTGICAGAHLTRETEGHIQRADRVLFLVADLASERAIIDLRPDAESLASCFVENAPRYRTYAVIIRKILRLVSSGLRTCVAFYGHPGSFVFPSHELVRQAHCRGLHVKMLPAISADASLIADLGFDPGQVGCQHFEATDFLVYRRRPDTQSSLVLWQIGSIGSLTHQFEPRTDSLLVLAERLCEYYAANHQVAVFEAAQFAVCQGRIDWIDVGELGTAQVSPRSTLFVPPAAELTADPIMLKRLGMRATRPRTLERQA